MRGDFYDVVVGDPANNRTERMQATRVGGSVTLTLPGRGDEFLVVKEYDKADRAVRTASFAKGFVLAVIQGTSPIGRAKKQVK